MKNKGAIEMGFNWLFAIVVGGLILFLAIYGASKFIKTQEHSLYTQTAEQLKSLFDPLETGLASGKSIKINFKKDSRIFFTCNEKDNLPFGIQKIAFSEKTFSDEFEKEGGAITVKDKYLFAEDIVEGKELYLFTKPFSMPFKVADLVVISSGDYCFYNSPEDVRDDLEDLNLGNIKFVNFSEKCNGIGVCFGRECEVSVYPSKNYVQKKGKKLYYQGNLIYSAIFSSAEIYECNVKRLMGKFNELGKVYLDKIMIIGRKQCYPTLEPKLIRLMNSSKELQDSRNLEELFKSSDEIDKINEEGKSSCRLF